MSPTAIAPPAAVPAWVPPAADDATDTGDRYEVEFGQRVELPPLSVDAAEVATELGRVMGNFVIARRLGRVAVETHFVIPAPGDPDKERVLDVAFVSFQRRPAGDRTPPGTPALRVVPDLAVEVLSPNDNHHKVMRKVQQYLTAGVRLVWHIDPILRAAWEYTPSKQDRTLRDGDALDGGDVLPGFRLPLADLFGPPATTEG